MTMLRSILVALLVAAALGGPARAQTILPVVHVATIPADSGAEPYYALDMGFYTNAGLDVRLSTMQNANEIMAAALSGTFDIIQSSITAAALARERGLPFVLIAPAVVWSSKNATSLLVVPQDSPIRTARELTGKTIALNALANVPGVAVDAWLDRNGGDSTAVKFVELPWSAMPAALAAGRIDAAFIAEPYLGAARRITPIRVLGAPYDAIADEFLLSGWFSTAHSRTTVSPTMVRAVYAERLDPALLQPVLDTSFKYKLLRTPLAAKEMLAPASP